MGGINTDTQDDDDDGADTQGDGATGPVYLGPSADAPAGYHDVQMPDGSTQQVHTNNLPDDMAVQAVAGDGGPNLFQMGQKQADALHQDIVGTPTDNGAALARQDIAQGLATPAAKPWAGQDTQGIGLVTGQPAAAVTPAAAGRAPGGGGDGGPSDKSLANIAENTATQTRNALDWQTDLAKQQAKGEFDVGKDYSARQADLLQQRQDIQQKYGQQADDALSKSKQIADDFIGQKVDPNRYWGSMSTGDHALAGLSMILSGIGAGIQGGGAKNLAVEHFNTAVENDIQAQRFNIEHGKEASEMYSKLSSDFQAAGLSKQHALDATDLAVKQKALTDANDVALSLGGQKAAADAHLAMAPLAMKTQEDTQKMVQGVQENYKTKAQIATEQLDNQIKRQQLGQAQAQAAQVKALGLPPGTNMANLVRGNDGSVGVAPNDKAIEAYNTEVKPAQDIHQVLDRIDAARKAGVVPNQAELQSLAGRLQQTTAEIGGEKETARNEEIIKAMTGDPTQYFSIRPSTNWSNREKALRGVANDTLNSASNRHNITWVRKPKSQLTRNDG